jgi:hypothetical protein
MGIRERLQSVTQFFQKAATRGHQLRQEDERSENREPPAGALDRQRHEPPQSGPAAGDRTSGQAGQRSDQAR